MKTVKAFAFFFIAIILCGTVGFAIAYIDSIGFVERQSLLVEDRSGKIDSLRMELELRRGELGELQKELQKNSANLTKLSFFKKRYPLYDRILDIVISKSSDYGYHPALILAIIQIESNFNPNAVSWAGAYGLMQVHYEVWKKELRIDKRQLFDPEYNIDLGLRILRSYHRHTGNISQALHLYNNGFLLNNKGYSQKVLSAYYNNIRTIGCQE